MANNHNNNCTSHSHLVRDYLSIILLETPRPTTTYTNYPNGYYPYLITNPWVTIPTPTVATSANTRTTVPTPITVMPTQSTTPNKIVVIPETHHTVNNVTHS